MMYFLISSLSAMNIPPRYGIHKSVSEENLLLRGCSPQTRVFTRPYRSTGCMETFAMKNGAPNPSELHAVEGLKSTVKFDNVDDSMLSTEEFDEDIELNGEDVTRGLYGNVDDGADANMGLEDVTENMLKEIRNDVDNRNDYQDTYGKESDESKIIERIIVDLYQNKLNDLRNALSELQKLHLSQEVFEQVFAQVGEKYLKSGILNESQLNMYRKFASRYLLFHAVLSDATLHQLLAHPHAHLPELSLVFMSASAISALYYDLKRFIENKTPEYIWKLTLRVSKGKSVRSVFGTRLKSIQKKHEEEEEEEKTELLHETSHVLEAAKEVVERHSHHSHHHHVPGFINYYLTVANGILGTFGVVEKLNIPNKHILSFIPILITPAIIGLTISKLLHHEDDATYLLISLTMQTETLFRSVEEVMSLFRSNSDDEE